MINFRVMCEHSDETLVKMISDLTNNRGFHLVEIRSCDIERDEDNAKVGEAFVICLKGHAWDYLQFRKELVNEYSLREFKYEGVRTLG